MFILGTSSNVIQIKNNYGKENGKQLEYLKQKIAKNDMIVYMNNEIGSSFAINFLDNKQFFYNPEDWGVINAYKVWYPQLEVHVDTRFLEKCITRVWIIDNEDRECYNKLFNNKKFKYIDSCYIETQYKDYKYNIILVERVKDNDILNSKK